MNLWKMMARSMLLTVAAGVLCGCGSDPTSSYTVQDQYRGGIKTVAVPVWTRGKDIYRRGLEFRLTEAVQKRVELNTPYKIAKRPVADTLLTGTIDLIEQQELSRDPNTGLPREKEITIIISFEWKDLRSGKSLVKCGNFRVTDTYISHTPFSEDFFQGSEGVINKAAERIVEKMEAPW
ncbi:MAG: hypothetical protein KAU28_11380 [Phycisphaerae bacterium]|nr:hypothetical protein [Phycisphaerae bacterium]